MELSENVEEKLHELVEAWAYENLEGKPKVYAYTMFYRIQKAMIETWKEIEATFK